KAPLPRVPNCARCLVRIFSMSADTKIIIAYEMYDEPKSVIYTNATREGLEEVLDSWVRSQIGRGKDSRKPEVRMRYVISIGRDLATDSFCTLSNTGNCGLTDAIVLAIRVRLTELAIKSLSEFPKREELVG